ncbi:MAG: T9SS type A sorting domain-containing protein, partial [Sphingobacteriaceae bacterium]
EVDSILKTVRMHMDGLDSNMRQGFRVMKRGDDDFEFFVNPPNGAMAPRAGMGAPDGSVFRMGRPEGKNSQAFSYANTDKEGISNRLNIRLSETGKETLKKITGSETPKVDLNVQDLNIFPSFSAGKLNVAFNLKTKGALEIKILDSDYQTILTDKHTNFNESYYKSINLPKNGVYYLVISQNGSWFVKRMVKE